MIFTVVNFLMTMVGMMLVDRKGRKFLLILGTSGIIVSLAGVGILFLRTEKVSVDASGQVQAMVDANQGLTLHFDRAEANTLLAGQDMRRSMAIAPRWRSFIPTATLPPRPAMFAPTIRPARPFRSRAQAVCRRIGLRRFSRIHLPILRRRGPHR